MIDEKKMQELQLEWGAIESIAPEFSKDLWETMTTLWRIARAAQDMRPDLISLELEDALSHLPEVTR